MTEAFPAPYLATLVLSLVGVAACVAAVVVRAHRRTAELTRQVKRETRDRRHMERALEAAQQQASIAFWRWPSTGDGALEWSTDVENVLGVPRSEIGTVDTYLQRVHPSHRGRVEDAYRVEDPLRPYPHRYEIEYRFVRSDDSVIWVKDIGTTVLAEEDCGTEVFGIVQNVTERVEAERNLHSTNTRLRLAQSQAKVGYWRWSFESETMTDWSEDWARTLGYPSPTSKDSYEDMVTFIHPDDRSRVLVEYQSADSPRRGFQIDYRMVRPDGLVTYVREIAEIERDNNGEPVAQTGIVQDVTDMVRASMALQESEASYRAFMANSSEGIWRIEQRKPLSVDLPVEQQIDHMIENAYFAECNDTAARMYGFNDSTELVNVNIHDVYPSNEVNRAMLRHLIESNYRIEAEESEETTEDGEPRFFLNSIIGVVEDGLLKTQWGTQTDITSLKRVEHKLLRYQAELEALVHERTRDLEEAQHNLLLKERLAAIGQLTATVSHELRNPLGTIRTSFDIIRRIAPDLPPETERAIDRIDRNIVRCVTIIEDLLDYTRVTEFVPARTAIDDWLRESLSEVEIPDGISLVTDLHADIHLNIDRNRLFQALSNVVQNACQAIAERAADANPGKIRVISGSGAHGCEIQICDNGPGIEPELSERVMEPLVSTRRFGVGLGLPLAKRVMEEHGGDLSLKSLVGEGTTATLRLPPEC